MVKRPHEREASRFPETAIRNAMTSAPAKVNLTLELLGIRPDGYHELRSLVMPISLYESVVAKPTADGWIACSTELSGIPPFDMDSVPPEKHLAVCAARALREAAGIDCGAAIRIVKRIPVGAGLGGGSADAAGALHELIRLWELNFSPERLAEIGASFASDVPAMVLGGAVLMEGRGERVRRLTSLDHAPPLWLVLAFCGEPISTGAVYAACPDRLAAPEGCLEHMVEAVRKGDARMAAEALHNGLESTVYARYPHTSELPVLLRGAGALGTLLSGSGGVVFGLAEDEEHAQSIASRLPSSLWTRVVHTVCHANPTLPASTSTESDPVCSRNAPDSEMPRLSPSM